MVVKFLASNHREALGTVKNKITSVIYGWGLDGWGARNACHLLGLVKNGIESFVKYQTKSGALVC